MLKINKIKYKKGKKKINTKEQVLVVAQEIKFARLLSGNEKKSRDRVLKTLKKWLKNCFQKEYEFKEEDFARIWKGLFYAVWMSDKPLVQEELCDNIAALFDEFPVEKSRDAILMFRAALKILGKEWYGIDQHRLDKFLMLVRRLVRAVFRVLARCEWSQQFCEEFTQALTENEGLLSLPTPTYARNSLSLLLHITECYLEELAKVSKGEIPEESVVTLVTPFMSVLAYSKEMRLAVASRRLFNYLVRQSEMGQEYEVRRKLWSQMGCPEGGPDALVPVSDDEEEPASGDENGEGDQSTSSALDPRAGRVDVVLPTLPVPAARLAQALKEYLKTTSASAHRRVKILYQRFVQLSKNEYPLRVKDDVPDPAHPTLKLPKAAKAARKLDNLEKKLISQSDELALRGLSKKHRKKLLAKSREGANIIEQLEEHEARATNGSWQVEDADMPKTKKRKLENKENVNNEKRSRKRKIDDTKRPAKKRKVDKKLRERSNKSSIKGAGSVNTKNNAGKEKDCSAKRGADIDKSEDTHRTPKTSAIKERVKNAEVTPKEVTCEYRVINQKGKNIALVEKNQNQKRKNDVTNQNLSKTPPDHQNKIEIKEKTAIVNGIDETKHKKICPENVQNTQTKMEKNQNRKRKNDVTNQNLNKTPPDHQNKIEIKEKTAKFDGIDETKHQKICPKNVQKTQTKKGPSLVVNKVRKIQKSLGAKNEIKNEKTFIPKKVKFVLKNNSMQGPVDYYKSVKSSPNIPFDSSKKPSKTNLKPNSTPSPINPFFKKKLRNRSNL